MMYKIYSSGMIEVITGPMFSGKSEELIKRIKILGYANIETLVIKPAIDNRWEEKKIITRAGKSIEAKVVSNLVELKEIISTHTYGAVCIDEIQFFPDGIVDVVKKLANNGVRVIVSGLDQDAKGNPFGVMPTLLAIADLVDKQQAVCVVCGKAATMTFKKEGVNIDETIDVGDVDKYEPRCREHHYIGEIRKSHKETI